MEEALTAEGRALNEAANTARRSVPRYVEEGGASAPPDPTLEWVVDPPSHFRHLRAVFATEAEANKHAEACPAHTRIYPRTHEPAPPASYSEYLVAYHGPTPPLTASAWLARNNATAYAASAPSESVLTEPTLPLKEGTVIRTAEDFCAEAARLVGGPRATTHGDKALNFRNIAELWNGYWRIKCRLADERLTTPFTAHDVGCMMELMKIARRFSGGFNADDYIDAAGYAGCTGEIAAREHAQRTD